MPNALQAVLDKAAQQTAPEPSNASEPAAAAKPTRSRTAPTERSRPPRKAPEEPTPSKYYRPVRDGKRFVGAHFHPEVARQLKVLAAEDGTTIQDLLEEAVDLLFMKNGKAKIADLVRKV